MKSTVFLFVFVVVITLVVAGFASVITKPLSTNARAYVELEKFIKLKFAEGVTGEAVLKAYLERYGRLTYTDDLSRFPPHPTIDDVASPLPPPSIAAAAEKCSVRILADYVSALMGRGVTDKVTALRKRVMASDSENTRRLFSSLFDDDDDQKHEQVLHHPGGHCTEPVKVDNGGEDCTAVCGSLNARHIRPPFIFGDRYIHMDPNEPNASYCWSGPAAAADPAVVARGRGEQHRRCSQTTGRLVFTDDGGWQCRPMFPHLFGGTDGTKRTACKFSPSEHSGDRESFETIVGYVDLLSNRPVPDHFAFAANTTYSRDLAKAATPEEFTKMASDPDFYFHRPVVCDCQSATDVLENPFVGGSVAAHLKFYGLYRCVSNPCAMTTLADDVAVFSPTDGTCSPGPMAPEGMVNAFLGEKRSPLAGMTPAMGLRLADYTTRVDAPSSAAGEPYDESRAKRLTRHASPVIPALILDDTNPTRHVLYVPTQKMVLTGRHMGATAHPSSVLHAECLPSPLNGRWGIEPPDPFSTAAFYVEPVADVLAGAVPQKPYEHDLLVVEALRNSRLVSGNVLGGSEILFSTLLAANRPDVSDEPSVDGKDPGEVRLARIRRYYAQMMAKRRLSTYEHLRLLKEQENDEKEKYSPWDTEFRIGDVKNSGIRNLAETFAIREGLLLRSYGAFGGWVVCGDSKTYDFSSLNKKDTTDLGLFNPAQVAFPTNLPTMMDSGIFEVDRRVLFDTRPYAAHFEPDLDADPPPLFPDRGVNGDYRLSVDSEAWGVARFRFLPDFRTNVFSKLDPRVKYDAKKLKIEGNRLPLSLFKKSLIEWGHPDGDIDQGEWLREKVDTSRIYHKFLLEVSRVVRPLWFTAAWETSNYHYRDVDHDHEQ